MALNRYGVLTARAVERRREGATDTPHFKIHLFDPAQMQPLPPDVSGPDNDLADLLDHYVARAIADPDATLYAFGRRWGPGFDAITRVPALGLPVVVSGGQAPAHARSHVLAVPCPSRRGRAPAPCRTTGTRYAYAGDGAPGRASGQGLDDYGAEWHVLSRTGKTAEDED